MPARLLPWFVLALLLAAALGALDAFLTPFAPLFSEN